MDDEAARLTTVIAEDDVLSHGERLDETKVLVHHADPRVERVTRRVEANLLAVELDLALVLPVEAGEDVREGGLARSVLAEQRVHLPFGRLEADVVVRDDAGEALRDPDHAHRRGQRGAGRAGASHIACADGESPHSASQEA